MSDETKNRLKALNFLSEYYARLLKDIDEYRLRSVIEFLELGFFEGISEYLGISVDDSYSIVKKYGETISGFRVLSILRTKDIRILAERILKLISSYPVTDVGRCRVLSITPTLNRSIIEDRLKLVDNGLEILKRLRNRGLLSRVLNILSKARFTKPPHEKPLVIATSSREYYNNLSKMFSVFHRVELIDSKDKFKQLISLKEPIIYVGEEPIHEPGVIAFNELPNLIDINPSILINYFTTRKPILECFIELYSLVEGFSDENLINRICEALSLVDEAEKQSPPDFKQIIVEYEEKINNELKKLISTSSTIEFRKALESMLWDITGRLKLTENERKLLWEAAFESFELPFQFHPVKIRSLEILYVKRMMEKKHMKLREIALKLKSYIDDVDEALKKLFSLDLEIALALFTEEYGLTKPIIGSRGFAFINGRNLLLQAEEFKLGLKLQSVSYALGETDTVKVKDATPLNIALLTGANSGGKTTLIETIAIIHILTLHGLPVPAEKAEVSLMPLYMFKRKTAKRTGSLEASLRSMGRMFSDSRAKLVLIDEFEALTEPGAMGRIIASIINNTPPNTYMILVTHLAAEITPHLLRNVRIDGIVAKGLDEKGNLIVDRQPIFNKLGISTPELVVEKLALKARNRKIRKTYRNIVDTIREGIRQTLLKWIK
ncbi:MAG: hypothetical protein QXY40_02260 [Candidatus Methanomethylicia archaeon]